MASVAVIGAGEIGRAVGGILTTAGQRVNFWDKDEEKITVAGRSTRSLPEVLMNTEYVFFAVPSWSMHEALAFAAPYLRKNKIIVALSKGINDQTNKTVDEMMKKILPVGTPFAMIGGAMIAEEINLGRMGVALIASPNIKTARSVASLFVGTKIITDVSRDIRGVAVAGALKNIYALGLGITEGLGWGNNERGFFFGQAYREMIRLTQLLGGKRDTILNPAIIADLVATSFSFDSLNHQTGLELARGVSPTAQSEGVSSLPPLTKIIDRDKLRTYPLLYTLARIIIGGVEVEQAFDDLQKVLMGSL